MKISEAVVVGVSEPGEKRWGRSQFPRLARIPGGEWMIDSNCNYRHPDGSQR